MKLVFSLITLVLATNLFAHQAQAGDWVKWVDCKDGHGNQLVIDVDVWNNSNYQMVLRPAPFGKPNVIEYLRQNSMVYSQPFYNEIVVPVAPTAWADFAHSDQYLTHKINLDNSWSRKFAPQTGAQLEVSRAGRSVQWYFDYCEKYY